MALRPDQRARLNYLRATRKMTRDIQYCLDNALVGPIPRFLRKAFGGYFRRCLVCGNVVLDDDAEDGLPVDENGRFVPYLIYRQVVDGEPRIEYAICMDCHGSVQNSLSRETGMRMNELFAFRVDYRQRFDRLIQGEIELDCFFEECVLTGTRVDPGGSYRLSAFCAGANLVVGAWPSVFCGPGEDLWDECFSEDSLAVVDEFVRAFLGVEAAAAGRCFD